ncbi:Alpha/Beta hydrolase protein [Paraphysoderma sedebokerense]|nr:Alpha/Beta hydrolase protein [Paraphysoderma sedebokerense]
MAVSFTGREVVPTSDPNERIPLQISATVAIPSTEKSESKLPAVLLVVGSGPIDRDGTVYRNGKKTSDCLGVYNQLSHLLSSKCNAVVLRYDKRGVGESIIEKKAWKAEWGKYEGGEDIYWKAGLYDLVEDAYKAYMYLTQHPRVDPSKIIILGHSEGAMIIPLICEKITSNPPLGAAFIAGYGCSLLEAGAYQRKQIVEEMKTAPGVLGGLLRLFRVPGKIERDGEKQVQDVVNSQEDVIRSFFGLVKTNAKWLREHSKYDPVAQSKRLTCHILVLTGEKDVQCDASFVAKAKDDLTSAKSVEAKVIPKMSHLLRNQETPVTLMNVKKEYRSQMTEPLSIELEDTIVAWVNRICS